MKFDCAIERCAFVVNRSLRKVFPDNYGVRCLYAAFGLHTLAKGMGLKSHMVAGDFWGLCVSHNGREMKHEGWETKGNDEFGHYWCVVNNHIVDLGLMYIQDRAPFTATNAPIVAWPLDEALPRCLLYNARKNYHTDLQLQLPDHMMKNFDTFLPICVKKMKALKGRPDMRSWLLDGKKTFNKRASNGDIWARAAKLVDEQSSSLTKIG